MTTSIRKLREFLVLPAQISVFEASYLRRVNRAGLVFFALHIPAFALIAWLNGTSVVAAVVLGLAAFAGPAIANATLLNPRHVALTYGVAAMFMGGLLVHVGQGPVQMEMHFYFFALIAMLAVYGNPLVILVAALTVALHHLALWFVLPESVFNYAAPLWVVAVHAAFVVLESVAGCFIARSFFDNVIGLEKIVEARTRELDRRNQDMRLVLDTVREGLLTIDRRGVPSTERSAAFDLWFGAPKADETLFDVIARRAPDFAACSRACWGEVVADILPLEVTLDQMPKQFVDGAVHFRVSYAPVGDGESPERFFVVLADVSAEVERERVEEEGREALTMFERILADRNGFKEFFEDASGLVTRVISSTGEDLPGTMRMLHTLKGNAAIYGLDSVARLCHELESHVADEGRAPSAALLSPLADRWSSIAGNVKTLFGARPHVIEIDEAQYERLEGAIRQKASTETLLRTLGTLKLEPTRRRLLHFAEQARRTAERLDKGEIDVAVEDHDLRLDGHHWSPFWSALVHAVRNAVDHGLEPVGARLAKGKSGRGLVSLRTYVEATRFVVEVADDGRGIDWQRIAQHAARLGLAASSDEELTSVVFRDDVSTAARVTDLSGRGVGMGAVRIATEALGGRIELASQRDQGTTLRMTFPVETMAHAPRRVGVAASLPS